MEVNKKKVVTFHIVKFVMVAAFIIIALNAACITPKGALRTHLFLHGHPFIAFVSPIVNDELHNMVDSEYLKKEKARCYTLVMPIHSELTGTYSSNYIVKRIGIFYYAQYYGEA